MLDTKQRFLIGDPASYSGTKFKYHVGAVVSSRDGTTSYHSVILYFSIEIQTAEDLAYLARRLLEVHMRTNQKANNILIMGYNRLVE